MLAISWASFLAAILIVQLLDIGFCIAGLSAFMYTAAYVPLLYSTFLEDSKDVVEDKILKGTIDRETDPLLYYTNQLKISDGEDKVANVKLIDFEELKFGPKIGVGGYGEVFRGKWRKLDVAIKRIFKVVMSLFVDVLFL